MVSDILLYCTFIIGLIVDHCSMPIHKYSEKDFTIHELIEIRVITKLPNSEQSYKGKVKAHKYINRQNQSTTGKL